MMAIRVTAKTVRSTVAVCRSQEVLLIERINKRIEVTLRSELIFIVRTIHALGTNADKVTPHGAGIRDFSRVGQPLP